MNKLDQVTKKLSELDELYRSFENELSSEHRSKLKRELYDIHEDLENFFIHITTLKRVVRTLK